ncbi:MAG: hypothetical protein IT440_02100, partial [Phycisphaeraceae bacterium]|nr:hypothetical protein [Phycisphaeraceae bacterium]
RDDDDAVRVDPWPFAADELCLQVPYRRVDARAWVDRAELGRAYAAAPVELMPAIVRPMR